MSRKFVCVVFVWRRNYWKSWFFPKLDKISAMCKCGDIAHVWYGVFLPIWFPSKNCTSVYFRRRSNMFHHLLPIINYARSQLIAGTVTWLTARSASSNKAQQANDRRTNETTGSRQFTTLSKNGFILRAIGSLSDLWLPITKRYASLSGQVNNASHVVMPV